MGFREASSFQPVSFIPSHRKLHNFPPGSFLTFHQKALYLLTGKLLYQKAENFITSHREAIFLPTGKLHSSPHRSLLPSHWEACSLSTGKLLPSHRVATSLHNFPPEIYISSHRKALSIITSHQKYISLPTGKLYQLSLPTGKLSSLPSESFLTFCPEASSLLTGKFPPSQRKAESFITSHPEVSFLPTGKLLAFPLGSLLPSHGKACSFSTCQISASLPESFLHSYRKLHPFQPVSFITSTGQLHFFPQRS